LQKRIAKLEEKEVDFDDDNDSAYIRLERYWLLLLLSSYNKDGRQRELSVL
jgi:hypothetical protein